jgi:hypothetical protein
MKDLQSLHHCHASVLLGSERNHECDKDLIGIVGLSSACVRCFRRSCFSSVVSGAWRRVRGGVQRWRGHARAFGLDVGGGSSAPRPPGWTKGTPRTRWGLTDCHPGAQGRKVQDRGRSEFTPAYSTDAFGGSRAVAGTTRRGRRTATPSRTRGSFASMRGIVSFTRCSRTSHTKPSWRRSRSERKL